ncbi:hypothetical protein EGR_07973 [Echinococcus granulosus]|uniref:Uncharacterized protein n=1 Tax=Echinococcus granulosus TaxID=6210 RepID=W6U9G3_ECHGR|nr:hypothetical protein EGR_07973 [Echinococcus granulosus]EUB57156.1 hypothetical protein EGR_07973 [Echinococcus granulosus]
MSGHVNAMAQTFIDVQSPYQSVYCQNRRILQDEL